MLLVISGHLRTLQLYKSFSLLCDKIPFYHNDEKIILFSSEYYELNRKNDFEIINHNTVIAYNTFYLEFILYKNDIKKIIFFEDEEIKYERSEKNGRLDGKYIKYYKNGNKQLEIDYVNDRMHGRYIEYHKNGDIQKIDLYEHGKKIG